MSDSHDLRLDRNALVDRHHEQLYRLALMVAGDTSRAATLVEQAYRTLNVAAGEGEAALIRSLLPARAPRRRGPWRWRADLARAARAPLAEPDANRLLDALAALTPAARLMLGLHYLRGMPDDEITALVGEHARATPAELRAQLRIETVYALGLVPADAEAATLLALDRLLDGQLAAEAALELRRALLEAPALRALRDALITVRDLLPRAIPALFAASPPRALTERLLAMQQPRDPVARLDRQRWARGGLALGVLALVAAIILAPSLLARRAGLPAAAPRTAAEIIDSAIHRFDRAPLRAGVLHEQYTVQLGRAGTGPAYLIERWYDYAVPHRLSVSVKETTRDSTRTLLEISSDGRSRIQYRYGSDVLPFERRAVDVRVSQAEAQALLPPLRSEPAAWFFSRGAIDQVDIGPLFLGQARSAAVALLGQTRLLGRPAYLLTYRTSQLPAPQLQPLAPGDRALRVLLTIDAQTYALLDVALLADGAEESTAQHLLRAETIDVLAHVPDEQFILPSSAEVVQRTSLQSVHVPKLPDAWAVSLEEAWRHTPRPLLAPQQLPDASMRGQALVVDQYTRWERANDWAIVLLYEGEFQRVMLLPPELADDTHPGASDERSAGAFRYRLLPAPGDQVASLAAEVYRPEAPNERQVVVLVDEYATAAEREATLQQVIASLTPVTEQSLPALQHSFSSLAIAGGAD